MAKTVKLGREGLVVPAIGLGCMGMSEFYGESDKAQNLKVLDRALELGCSFWDSSDMYGPFTNEALLGKALSGRRDRVILATKFGISRNEKGDWFGIRGGADYIRQACEASLKRLGTDYIDLYYQHRLDPNTPIEETIAAMSELVREGKVRYIGLSEADARTIERAHAIHPISAVQTEYSLWSRDVEEEILPMMRRLGIGFVAYSPLGRGFLTGALRSRADLSQGDWRLENPRFTDEAMAANLALVEQIETMAKHKGVQPAQLALAWLLSRGEDIAMIPGTRRIERLEQNIASAEIELTPQEADMLTGLADMGVVGARY
ncbi:aldo/keto reductase [uncultured Cohaesibacter sp.]|uniref:aldo/keto reductase n=1 Tax=uncultured Cohaesibacter sp. TaxID=1002546 RepID=UPI003747F804